MPSAPLGGADRHGVGARSDAAWADVWRIVHEVAITAASSWQTARDVILAALPAIRALLKTDVFAPEDVIEELAQRGSHYRPSTIRTHVVSRMCRDAPNHHAVTYDDLQRSAQVSIISCVDF